MNDARKAQRKTILIAIFVFAIGGIAASYLFSRKKTSVGTAPFTDAERAIAPELEIKGDVPDGSISWNAIIVPPSPVAADVLSQGRELFAKACAGCHGAEGKGDGPLLQKYDLSALPANLSLPLQSIKIRSTMGGSVPRDEDLFRTLTRGLPDTPMYSYRGLSEGERWALVHFIKTLSKNFSGTQPEPVDIPKVLPKDSEMLSAGKNMYLNLCANCHGNEGLGGTVPLQDSLTGKPFPGVKFARSGGTLTLGGSSETDLARTLLTGFHDRSPMRSFKPYFYPQENPLPAQKSEGDRKLWSIVHYVRQLMDAQIPK
ncbi:MAG TPA: cytochrome c [Planctomycetota bacterium]|nr:cytochrome c [Planctomycetota bacterium]